MSNYTTLKNAVASAVYTNGNGEITGAGLQAVLLQIIDTVGSGYNFMGVANSGTSPGTPDANVFYIVPSGTYTNFGSRYTVLEGNIGVFTYNGSWSHQSLQVSSVGGGSRAYTDNASVNSMFSAVLLDSSVENVRVTIGTAHDINIVFRNSGGTQVGGGGFYYSNIDNMPASVEFVGGSSPNIVYFNNDGIRNISDSNYGGGTNVYYDGVFNAFAYDEDAFYEWRRTSPHYLGGAGSSYIDDETIAAILPYAALTTDVEKVGITIAQNAINIKLLNGGGATIVSRYIADVAAYKEDTIEVNTGKNYLLTDGIFVIDKRAFAAFCEIHDPFPPIGYVERTGNVSAVAYSYEGKELLFGDLRSRDWGTADVAFSDGLLVGSNIYNTVDCFRFPAHISAITIPCGTDGIVEVYRTRVDDVQNVSKTTLLGTVKVKAGTYEYPLSLDMEAGEGIGLCSLGAGLRYYTGSGFRLASYNVSTLLRGSAPNGFDNGSMMCAVKYRYFTQSQEKVLKGFKVSILGDSISTFGSDYSYDDPYYPTSNVSNYMQTWWGKLQQDGAVILANTSVSRTTVEYPGDANAQRWLAYDARVSGLVSDTVYPDIIIVNAGINDMFSSSSIGDFDYTKGFSDYSTLDRDKFCSAYQLLVMKLLDNYPDAKIFVSSTFKAGHGDWGFPEHNGTRFLMQLNAAIKSVAESLGVGFIDFYGETGISWKQMNDGDYGDVIHPNAQGHYEYYVIARRKLAEYIQNNRLK